MARMTMDIDDASLARAQRVLGTATKPATVNAALELAAAVDAERRSEALAEFRDLLDRMDLDLIR
jgi:Arc/MetJ family transcription regulator